MLLRVRSFLFAALPLAAFAVIAALGGTPVAWAQTAKPAAAATAAPAAPAPAAQPATPAAIQTAAPTAGGESDPYTVTGVTVDVTADNANIARDRAMAQAQVKAWGTLVQRLVPGSAAAPPKLSDTDMMRVVRGITVDDERVTPTRYISSMTVRFRAEEVRNHLADTGAQYAEPPSNAFVILPVTIQNGRPILWEDHTPWRDAWESRTTGGLVPTMVPSGDLGDIAAIGAADAVAGDPAAIDRIARKYNAPGVIVAKLSLPAAGQPATALTVDVARFDTGGQRHDQSVAIKPDPADRPEDLVRRAMIQTAAAIDQGYRQDNTIAAGPEQTISVVLPLTSAADWVDARQRLSGANMITRAELLGLSRNQARITVVYRGDPSTLKQQLATRDLDLQQVTGDQGPQWQLRLLPHGAAASAVQPAQPIQQTPLPLPNAPTRP